MPKKYVDSAEFSFRRMVRAAIRRSEMTKSDRDVTLAMANLWFHHRNGPKKHIHPGRKKLAKSAGVSIKTVARCLAKLQAARIIIAIKYPRGEGQNPTQYTVDLAALLTYCGCDWLDDFMWQNGAKCPTTFAQNVPPLAGQNVPQYITTSNKQKPETKKPNSRFGGCDYE